MTRVPVYILAGGKSSRFGSDKARATLHDQPLLQHVAQLVAPVAASVTVVADRADKYHDLHLRTIADTNPGRGPLAGLYAALSDLPAHEPWLLLVACDTAVLHIDWLNALLTHRDRNPDALAVAFRHDRWQPMPALYARAALAQVDTALHADRRALHQLLDQLPVTTPPYPHDWPKAWQINTPADLSAHQRP